ncbi:MAG: hypothetical protein A07HR60_00665 [uncultured archaeon A07HR60]|nr:MAG: hypothetical protein A07HR60_00665 [uncultured archaeon A07HR60]
MTVETFGPQAVVAGAIAGVAATLVMDLIMPRLPEGDTTPFVAAGVLTDTPPDEAPARLASTVHYVAGTGAGVLFVTIAGIVAWLVGLTGMASQSLGVGPALFGVLVTGLVYPALMIGFFVVVPLPRAQGFSRERADSRPRLAISACVHVALTAPLGSGHRDLSESSEASEPSELSDPSECLKSRSSGASVIGTGE